MLFTLLLPAQLGLPVEDLRPLSPDAVLATSRPGELVIGHPALWNALLQATPSGWPPGIIGVTSGEPCPDATVIRLGEAGLAGMLDIYGSREVAGVGWRRRVAGQWSDGSDAYRLLACWRRDADDRLSRDDGLLFSPPDRLQWDGGSFRIGSAAAAS